MDTTYTSIDWSSTFEVPLVPKPKGRPRVSVVGGFARTYTPKSTRDFEDSAAEIIAKNAPPSLLSGPVDLSVTFVLPRPKRLDSKKHPVGFVRCDKRPDTSNLLKSIEDAIQKSGQVWSDDSQVQKIYAEKVYAEKLGKPRIIVTLAGRLS